MKVYTGKQNDKTEILGVNFDHVTMKQAVEQIVGDLVEKHNDRSKMVTTANPEIVMAALKDSRFMTLVNQSDLIVADGIGIIYGSRILGRPLPERVAGFDMIQQVFHRIKDQDIKVYFLGAAPGVAIEAKNQMNKRYPGLKIVGTRDGYFQDSETQRIVEEINALQVDLLLVGLGAPKQEIWMMGHQDQLNVKVMVGVGGSFDGMSGVVKRAPKFFIKLNLEWFYRLIKQPSRWKRMLQLPLFLIKTIQARLKGVKHGI